MDVCYRYGMARQLGQSFLGIPLEGIWHTGVVVFGKEFFYGPDISSSVPGRTPYGVPTKILTLGETALPEDIFTEFLGQISSQFIMNNYDVLEHNCNNFSDTVARFLLGRGIPEEIISLPKRVMETPLGSALLKPILSNIQNGFGQTNTPNVDPLVSEQNQPTNSRSPSSEKVVQPNLDVSFQHPHQKLKLVHVTNQKPNLFDSGNLQTISTKLVENYTSVFSQGFSPEEQKTFETLLKLLQNSDGNRQHPVPTEVYDFLAKLVNVMPVDQVFPCLDLMRLLVLFEPAIHHYSSEKCKNNS
eukprot:TRINITY_DN3219_c0_g1_i19.p1 TRINITY_DN3219_c0_g1~~TRINITY_DN3219_c0_g1_i19.p1  ORF type:complete len:301 (-),score=50.60 TRINITY_DN3219_c0_g1_i19:532-1434(-)